MIFHTFGNNTNKVVIFIHGMLTPWQIWNEAIEYWSKDYYVILPELDAHTEETKSTFESVEKEAEKIKNYLCDTVCGKVYMMCGLSMGGRIAAIRMKEVSPQTEIRCYKGYAHAYLACFEQQKWIGEVSKWLKMEV